MVVGFERDGRLVQEGNDGCNQLGSGRGVKEARNCASHCKSRRLIKVAKIDFRSKVVFLL